MSTVSHLLRSPRIARGGALYGRVARPSKLSSKIDLRSNLARHFAASSTSSGEKYFRPLEVTESGVAIVRLDGPKPVNTISFDMSKAAKELWKNEVESRDDVKAVSR